MQADWPERFIYVCNAGRAALVNALPLIHAGLDRVARVVVFCGADGPDTLNAAARAEAVDPARRLEDCLTEWTARRLSRAKGTFEAVYGNPLSVSDWRGHMQRLRHSADLPILFNFKSGTKEMAIGGAMGLGTATDADLVTIGDNPPQVELVTPDGQEPLPIRGGHLNLPRLLRLYGFCEHVDREPERAHQQRVASQDWCTRHKSQIEAFCTVFVPKAVAAWPVLQRLTRPVEPTTNKQHGYQLPCVIALPDADARSGDAAGRIVGQAIGALDGLAGLTIKRTSEGSPTEIEIVDPFVARFLRGGWLEAVVYLSLLAAAKGRNDVTVAANLALAPATRPAERMTEIDVAVMIGSQLVIVEAKSSSMTGAAARDSGERSLAQVESTQRQLTGQVGRVFIVNPCITEETLRRQQGAVIARTRQSGQELFVGPDAIERLVRRMAELIGSLPVTG